MNGRYLVEQSNTYRLLIGDDHVLFRRGLRTILSTQPDLNVVDEASSIEEVVQKEQRQSFDLILLNAALIAANGINAAVQTPTLLLTGDTDDRPNSISRSAPASEIVAMVRSLARLARKSQDEWSVRDLSALAESTRSFGTFPGLTARESEILRLLAENLTAREVANELGLSIKTVEAHKLNVMRKLGVHNRASLIRFATEHGVISTSA